VDQPVARPPPTQQNTNKKGEGKHLYAAWDSNPRSQWSSNRQIYAPQTARPLCRHRLSPRLHARAYNIYRWWGSQFWTHLKILHSLLSELSLQFDRNISGLEGRHDIWPVEGWASGCDSENVWCFPCCVSSAQSEIGITLTLKSFTRRGWKQMYHTAWNEMGRWSRIISK
jgi:hypothetical protein